jgi:hypothetical protein
MPGKGDLLHIRFGLTGTRAVNTTLNIQVRELRTFEKGPPPTVERWDGTTPVRQHSHLVSIHMR